MVSAGWTEEPVALIQLDAFRTVLHLMSVDISYGRGDARKSQKNLTELLKAALKLELA